MIHNNKRRLKWKCGFSVFIVDFLLCFASCCQDQCNYFIPTTFQLSVCGCVDACIFHYLFGSGIFWVFFSLFSLLFACIQLSVLQCNGHRIYIYGICFMMALFDCKLYVFGIFCYLLADDVCVCVSLNTWFEIQTLFPSMSNATVHLTFINYLITKSFPVGKSNCVRIASIWRREHWQWQHQRQRQQQQQPQQHSRQRSGRRSAASFASWKAVHVQRIQLF